MKYFTSDLHIGDDRIGIKNKPNLFYRPFASINEQNHKIIQNLKHLSNNDELFIVGDVVYDFEYLELLSNLPNCQRTLIIGNYDENQVNKLKPYFDNICEYKIIQIDKFKVLLNHYPIKCLKTLNMDNSIDFAITGHVHGLWKVQKKLINVSTDAWHFKPVSETEILFCFNAMQNFYDENVFISDYTPSS